VDDYQRQTLQRLPLAEAALRVWAWITHAPFLDQLYQRYRGRSYEQVLTFPVMVYLMADALLHYHGSGRRCFQEARRQGTLEASLTAVFGKLRRLPIPLSMGFLTDCTVRLMALFPEGVEAVELPASLAALEPVLLDGKAIKNVAKRLKPLQGAKGGVLGGRALVALRLRQGLAVAMHAHPDGHVNDVRFVPELLPQIRQVVPGTRLFVGDRQFCLVQHLEYYREEGDHFLIRYSKNVLFTRDAQRPVRSGRDGEGRSIQEEWGWLGAAKHPRRRYVRRITVQRSGDEAIHVVTDLEDADVYPAADLLWLYRQRWGIERMFQQVTEVFGLQGLIGSSPRASVFQLAFCLVLYNILQVVRAYVARGSKHRIAEVSTEKLFADVQDQLIAWNMLATPADTLRLIVPLDLKATCGRLRELLDRVWKKIWRKAGRQQRGPSCHSGGHRGHVSAHRLLQETHERNSKPANSSSG
jgi:hypothetical protein